MKRSPLFHCASVSSSDRGGLSRSAYLVCSTGLSWEPAEEGSLCS
jgi:hypothetical protein